MALLSGDSVDAKDAAEAAAVVKEAESVAAHDEASLEAQATAGMAVAGVPDVEAEEEEPVKSDPLQVEITRARGLRFSDGKPAGVTDPYCICEIPGKPKAMVQTLAIDGLQGVHWNHKGEIAQYNPGDSLVCSVYDRDALPRESFLGKVVLSSAQLMKGFKGELGLTEAGKGVKAFIRLAAGRADALSKVKETVSEEDASEAEEGESDSAKDSAKDTEEDTEEDGEEEEEEPSKPAKK